MTSLLDNNFIPITSQNMKEMEFNVHDSYKNSSAIQSSSFISRVSALTKGIDEDVLRINFVKSKEQKNSFNCGCFAMANTVAFCYGKSPEKIILDSFALRSHLKKCLDHNNISLFSINDGERKHQKLEKFERKKVFYFY